MRLLLLLGLILFITSGLSAQNFSINLSPRHLQKLETYKSGHKRLKQYYKFFKHDSARGFKKLEKRYKHILDSAYRADTKQEKLRRKLARKGITLPDTQLSHVDSLNKQLKQCWAIMKDSSSSDSIKSLAKAKVQTIALEKAKQYPGFQNLMDKYQLGQDSLSWEALGKQVPGLDTLSGLFDSSPDQLMALAEKTAESSLMKAGGVGALGDQFAQAEQLKSLPEKYMKEYQRYSDVETMKKEGKEKAVEEALDYFAEHATELQAAQQKLSKLLSKYREFSNSNDLSTAVKHTSMEGKSFKEHLVIGGNFNVVSTEPFSIDLSPQLGYKFTTRFYVGVGMNYRWTYTDSIKNSWYVSPENTSYKLFVNYNVIKSFFAYAEWEKSGIKTKSNDKASKVWKDNYFAGAGKRFLIHPKLYLTLTAMYNLNSEDENPIHPKRFQIRMGFQLSELATRQKKIYYDPNR